MPAGAASWKACAERSGSVGWTAPGSGPGRTTYVSRTFGSVRMLFAIAARSVDSAGPTTWKWLKKSGVGGTSLVPVRFLMKASNASRDNARNIGRRRMPG